MAAQRPSLVAASTARRPRKRGTALAAVALLLSCALALLLSCAAALLSRGLLTAGLAQAASAHRKTPATTVRRHPTPRRLFAPDSIWNRAVPRSAPLDPGSRPMVKELAREAQSELALGVGPWVSTDTYSTTVYTVAARAPTVRVALAHPSVANAALRAAFARVPIPAGAVAARGTDAVMTVYQPARDRLWEFWQARRLGDVWHASWGGAIEHVSQSPGYYTRASWPGAATNWGAGGASFPVIAGLMTIAELRAAHIDHALSMALPSPRGGVFAWPAQRTDGSNGDRCSIPEGAHLRLDPRLDVAALGLPPITRMIALAAQRYGIVITNRTNSSIDFYAEDPNAHGPANYSSGGPTPYYGPGGLFDGLWPAAFLHDFPWRSLQVLRMRLRTTAHHHRGGARDCRS
jgi:hypothetical protein